MASAPESAQQQRDESSLRAEHWLPEAEGNCVVERRGGEQPEANCQSVSKTKLNSIRPDALASLLAKGEAWNQMLTKEGQGDSGALRCGETVSVAAEMHGVVGDRMAGSWSDVNQGSRSGTSNGVHGQRPEEPFSEGDRVSVGARKRGNARGAKGDRDVEVEERPLRPRKTGVVPARADRAWGTECLLSGRKKKGISTCLWTQEGERKPCCRITFSSRGLTDARKSRVGPSLGEPDAGDPPVRFGRGSGE